MASYFTSLSLFLTLKKMEIMNLHYRWLLEVNQIMDVKVLYKV